MPYSDELDREYEKEEAKLWREAQFASKSKGVSVRLIPLAQEYSYDEQQVGQLGRTWQNDGLCITSQSGRVLVTLTTFGRRFTFEDSYGDL